MTTYYDNMKVDRKTGRIKLNKYNVGGIINSHFDEGISSIFGEIVKITVEKNKISIELLESGRRVD